MFTKDVPHHAALTARGQARFRTPLVEVERSHAGFAGAHPANPCNPWRVFVRLIRGVRIPVTLLIRSRS